MHANEGFLCLTKTSITSVTLHGGRNREPDSYFKLFYWKKNLGVFLKVLTCLDIQLSINQTFNSHRETAQSVQTV